MSAATLLFAETAAMTWFSSAFFIGVSSFTALCCAVDADSAGAEGFHPGSDQGSATGAGGGAASNGASESGGDHAADTSADMGGGAGGTTGGSGASGANAGAAGPGAGGAGESSGGAGDDSGGAGHALAPLCGGECFPDSTDSCGPPDAEGAEYGCYILPGPDTACMESQGGALGAICAAAEDCAPGLGCAPGPTRNECRPYCCEGLCNDAINERCLPLPTAEAPPRRTTAPFCVPPNRCELERQDTCAAELACMLHADGTTWCETPGEGLGGDACPCAEGYVCAGADGRCRRVCSEAEPDVCGEGQCQVVANFPQGYGICVDGLGGG